MNSRKIYTHALNDLGLAEVDGPASEPRIKLAIQSAAKWLDPDDSKTAWCGCLRGLWGLETGTGVPKEHYRAASWLKWGRAVPMDPKLWMQGDTVVLDRKGGKHVGLLSKWTDKYIWVLGGNQSNSTNVARFDRRLLEGVRRA